MKDPVDYRRFGYPLRLLPNAQLAKLEEGVASLGEARKRSGASVGYPGWPLIYYLTLCSIDPAGTATVVETGTNHGCSTIALAQAVMDNCAHGCVHTFEIDEEIAAIAEKNVTAAGLADLVTIHVGSTKDRLEPVLEELGPIDLAFLDGSHLLDDVMFEFERVVGRLRRGALVIFDNTYPIAEAGEDPRVNGALKQILATFGGSIVDLPFVSWYTPGVAIWQREAPSLGV